ncbi:hypothetical protein M3Y94_00192500 [Aphelenchoides besseyi]|nr:hypothetical protein M3Y94_00192500 [Aphelenchoides besseyi]KAI6236782.1 Cell death protein 4 [Aphelenchoides besseyi]
MDRLDYILGHAQVPRLHQRQIRRQIFEKFEKFGDKFLQKKQSFMLINGIAGVGKTNLLCYWLRTRSDICGHYFKNIVWLTDRNSDPRHVAALGMDALLLLPNSFPVDFSQDQTDSQRVPSEELRSCQRFQTMRIMLSKSIEENPQTLIILDDVVLKETIDLFMNLKCSVIATSTRADIFDHVDNCLRFPLTMDDVFSDDVVKLCCAYGIDSVGEHSAEEIMRHTGGNFALMEKLLVSSQSNTESLQFLLEQLHNNPLDVVKCCSYYQYDSLHTCCHLMVQMIDRRLQEQVPTLALLQPSNWLDMKIVSLIWPVDVADTGVNGTITRLVSLDMNAVGRHSLVGYQMAKENQSAQIRIDPLFHYYLISSSNSKELLTMLNIFKSSLQNDHTYGEDGDRLFENYLVNNSNSISTLESLLQRIEKRKKLTSNSSKTRWFSNWFTSVWYWR